MQLTLPRDNGPRAVRAPSNSEPFSQSSRNPYQPLEEPQDSMKPWWRMAGLLYNAIDTVVVTVDLSAYFYKTGNYKKIDTFLLH